MENINIYDNFLSNEDLQKCNEYVIGFTVTLHLLLLVLIPLFGIWI